MLRLFLKNKLFSKKNAKNAPIFETEDSARNRRAYTRYAVDKKSLTVMNEQDILVIRDISSKGFASDVSPRAYDRFSLGDIYSSRIRHHGEIQEIEIKVAWKRNQMVGFELFKPRVEVLLFFQKLIRPMQLAQSLTLVDSSFVKNPQDGYQWYHGQDVDLHIWQTSSGSLKELRVLIDEHLVEWSKQEGIKTGKILRIKGRQIGLDDSSGLHRTMDKVINEERYQLAHDLVSALNIPEKQSILDALDGEPTS